MVQLSLLLSAAALAIQSSISACVIEKREALSLYDAVAINPGRRHCVYILLLAESDLQRLRGSPKPT
jgi:hypothetical protein